jgi:hypothetical protein
MSPPFFEEEDGEYDVAQMMRQISAGSTSARRSPTFRAREEADDVKALLPQVLATPVPMHRELPSSAAGSRDLDSKEEEPRWRGNMPPALLSMSAEAQQMMQAALLGDHDYFQITPKLSTPVVNPFVLSLLFPPKEGAGYQKRFLQIAGRAVEIDPFIAAPEKIRKLPILPKESAQVTELNLSRLSLSDEQLKAVASLFPHVTSVTLSMCPNLTDEALYGNQLVDDRVVRGPTFPRLTSLNIISCDGITNAGLQLLDYSTVEEFGLTTKGPVEPATLQRVAQSKQLKNVVLDFCSMLTQEALLALKTIEQPLAIRATACDQIRPDLSELLNSGRDNPTIALTCGKPSEAAQIRLGLPRLVEPPPEVPDKNDIFSFALSLRVFDHIVGLPHRSVIGDFPFEREIGGFNGFRGFHLSSQLPQSVTDQGVTQFPHLPEGLIPALVERFPEMEVVSIYDASPDLHAVGALGHQDITCLRLLTNAKTLYLGKLPTVVPKWLETMFSNITNNEKTWQELKKAHLAGMPVTDAVLDFLSQLPKLRELTLSNCTRITAKGLKKIQDGCLMLTHLAIDGCMIDAFTIKKFRETRPKVTLKADKTVDATAVIAASQDATKRLFLENEGPTLPFLRDSFPNRDLDLSYKYLKENEENLTQFYRDHLTLLGLENELALNQSELIQQRFQRWDILCQEYVNTSIFDAEILQEWFRVGYFTNRDAARPPQTHDELHKYLTTARADGAISEYRRRIHHLNVSSTNAYNLPIWIQDLELPELQTLNLQGTRIPTLNPGFLARCTKLAQLTHPNGNTQVLIEEEDKPQKAKARALPTTMRDELPPPVEQNATLTRRIMKTLGLERQKKAQ